MGPLRSREKETSKMAARLKEKYGSEMKAAVQKELGIKNVRVNSAGCLDRCELGPCLVIYPEGVWYRIDSPADIDAVLQAHVIEGGRATSLLLSPG